LNISNSLLNPKTLGRVRENPGTIEVPGFLFLEQVRGIEPTRKQSITVGITELHCPLV
jgi:hypothetical protein